MIFKSNRFLSPKIILFQGFLLYSSIILGILSIIYIIINFFVVYYSLDLIKKEIQKIIFTVT